VISAAVTVNLPQSGGNCASALFYFLAGAGVTFNRFTGSTDTFDIYDGTTHTPGATTYTVASGQYLTIWNGTGTTWHFLVESPIGTTGGGGITSITTNGNNGLASISGTTINVPMYGLALTTTGTGAATLVPGSPNSTLNIPTPVAGASGFPASNNDAIQYVSPQNGNDGNNGLSWATAKMTIPGAYAALPAIGGVIYVSSTSTMPNGCAQFSTPIVIGAGTNNEKPVQIRGAGEAVTCFTYTGTATPAFQIETDHSSTISDMYLNYTVGPSSIVGLSVGSGVANDLTHQCNKCAFIRVNIGGFDADVSDSGYGTLYDHVQLRDCDVTGANTGGANNGTAFLNGGDDQHIIDSEIGNCNTGIWNSGTGSMTVAKTVILNNGCTAPNCTGPNWGKWVYEDGSGFIFMNQVHFYNQSTGQPTWWFTVIGASHISIVNSEFESQRNGTAANPYFANVGDGGAGNSIVLIANTINHYGNEAASGEFMALMQPVSSLSANSNNLIINHTNVPRLIQATQRTINQVEVQPTANAAVTSTAFASTNWGTPAITSNASNELFVNWNLYVQNSLAGTQTWIAIYRTQLATIPALGAPIPTGDVQVAFSGGMMQTTADTIIRGGGMWDTGVQPGIAYRYYIALYPVTGTATLTCNGTNFPTTAQCGKVQVTEQ
jgi:hypothetical protein